LHNNENLAMCQAVSKFAKCTCTEHAHAHTHTYAYMHSTAFIANCCC